jgi:hypothetical protein
MRPVFPSTTIAAYFSEASGGGVATLNASGPVVLHDASAPAIIKSARKRISRIGSRKDARKKSLAPEEEPAAAPAAG